MDTQIRYSELFSNILEKNYSNCRCPTSFFGDFRKFNQDLSTPNNCPLRNYNHDDDVNNNQPNVEITFPKTQRPASKLCSLGPNCQFGPKRESPLPKHTDYSTPKCTCFLQCTCVPEKQQTQQKKSDANKSVCNESECICKTCLCKPKEPLLNEAIGLPQSSYNNAPCIRSVCLCENNDCPKDLFPFTFRNTIKFEAQKLMTDEAMKKECDEIKLLLSDPKKSIKIDDEKCRTKSIKSTVDFSVINDDYDSNIKPTRSYKEVKKKSVIENIDQTKKLSSKSTEQASPNKPIDNHTKSEVSFKKEKKRASKKLKTCSFRSRNKTCYSKRNILKKNPKKPLNIRYYYSGNTEHYGVRLGHKFCLNNIDLVPKNMGWLWNIEDPSKGIRERKGWPPGFIASDIMQLLSHYRSDIVSNHKVPEHKAWTSRHSIVPDYMEPKEEPPLLHILQKGRTYNITLCPKSSDQDVEPTPIPFTITRSKHEDDTESSNSTLEFEFHSPKPQLRHHVPVPPVLPALTEKNTPTHHSSTAMPAPSTDQKSKQGKHKLKNKSSREFENSNWEDQPTHIQNIS